MQKTQKKINISIYIAIIYHSIYNREKKVEMELFSGRKVELEKPIGNIIGIV